jgi:hypothetical protein
MKKQKSLINHMYSRAAMGTGGEDPIKSKKLEAKPTKMETPSSFKGDLGNESKEYKKYVTDTDKKGRRNASIRNLKKFGAIVGGGAATLVGGYYALTKKVGGKEQKDYSGRVTGKTPEKRIWRWKSE